MRSLRAHEQEPLACGQVSAGGLAAPASCLPDWRRIVPALLVLFAGSGCAALIYEVVWFQLLQLVIGLTGVSLGILLGIYMGGMCLGSLLLPRCIPNRHHPLRVYAMLEFGIGVSGVAILFLLPWAAQFYTQAGGRGLAGILLRGIVAAAFLLLPTMLMGATLPAIARWMKSGPEGASWLGFCYSSNLAGAVMGCLLAGFYLLRVHDMATASYTAAAINVAVGVLALGLSVRAPQPAAVVTARDSQALAPRLDVAPGEAPSVSVIPSLTSRMAYLAIALSGMAALGAEVTWTRLLSLLIGGTVYTFSIILAVFLLGLGIGSSVGAFLTKSAKRPGVALGWCQMLLVGAIAWAACMINESLPYWPINPTLSANPWLNFQLDFARCLWTILPAAALWGASFPLALAAAVVPGHDLSRQVGRLYAANTVGAILGALGFSLLVIPWLGTQSAERLLLGISAVGGLLMLVVPLIAGWPTLCRRLCPVAVCVGLTLWLAWRVAPAPWGLTAYGRFVPTFNGRMAPGIWPENAVPLNEGWPDIYCTYLGEGLNGSVAVTMQSSGERSFHSAGKIQASNGQNDMRVQRMLGHLAALAHPHPESVLVVACGAGVTAGSFVVHPEVKRIVICDIEPLVPKYVAPMFKYENYNVVLDPRTEIVLDDGRHFVRTAREKFDIITSDPIDPWVKGCAALNTIEYYQMCKEHLNPGGVMALWVPLYENNVDSAKSLIATFFKVFPDGILWSNDFDGYGYDAVLFGQVGPTRFDLGQIQARLDQPNHARVKVSLADVGFASSVDLFRTYAGRARDLQDWTRDGQLNTDLNLRLQYLAGMWFNSYIGSQILAQIDQYYSFPDDLFVGPELAINSLRTQRSSR
jgi:spermidine synthase